MGLRLNKRVQVGAELRTSPTQSPLQPANLSNASFDRVRAGLHPHALLRMDEAAEYLRFVGERAADSCRQFLQRNHVRLLRVGREYRVRQGALDQLLDTLATGQSLVDVRAHQAVARLGRHPAARGPQ